MHGVITRTAIGHTEYQEYAFPCSKCGVEIRFGISVNDEEIKYNYTKLINASWVTDETDAKTIEEEKMFDCENLIPLEGEHFSPFLSTVFLPQNPQQYINERDKRWNLVVHVWPSLSKIWNHLERKQYEYFDVEARKQGFGKTKPSASQRLKTFLEMTELFGKSFRIIQDGAEGRIRQRINLAEMESPVLIRNFIRELKVSNTLDILFTEVHALRERWCAVYQILFPVYVVYYWDEKIHSLDTYTLAQKRYEEIKSFYVDSFETFCRLSAIAGAFEGIIICKSIGVPFSGGIKTFEEFISIKNGVKPDILKNLPIGDLFCPYIDSKLRNAIGHHSANFDVGSDSIIYLGTGNNEDESYSIRYVEFCEKIARLYGQLELVWLYLKYLKGRSEGINEKII